MTQASNVAGQNWGSAKEYAEAEFKKLNITGQMIMDGIRNGTMSIEMAQLHFDQQKKNSAAVVGNVHLMNLVQAQAIINAATAVLTSALNVAIGAIKFV